ncbi:MAG TPA: hypothetical protein VFV38_05345 [Ktedonobacteraceae bacterium]|nr:hypothetical protein [Ktedonobacteraceae bacterium]
MSNKYQREIEEILRNLERTEPKAGFGRKAGGRLRRKPRRRISLPHLTFAEWCLVLASVAALSAGGWAYAYKVGNGVTGIIALIGTLFVVLVALSSFLVKPPYSSSRRYNNVTPLRSNIFSRMGTSWHLLMLKLRYRKGKDRER